ncbi:hypothetical protein KAZ82_01450 [Candidatus Babeliales bacterium]|nr:hypothetical protein [Candidatus Babeliales bacterium]
MQHIPSLITHPAHLWIADTTTLQYHVIETLQKIFCTQNHCKTCLICTQIATKQYHKVFWIEPENNYTIDLIDQALQNTQYALAPNDYRFIIFNKADTLNAHCNNRLLKTIEEPHRGYIFILLTNNTQNILPTVISRCFIKEFFSQNITHSYHNFIQLLFDAHINHTLNFLKMLEQFEIKETETKQILDLMLQQLHQQLHQAHMQPTHNINHMITITNMIAIIKQAFTQLPAPGSAKIFWKNFYLQLIS